MALRNILQNGDRNLLKKSRAITAFDDRLHILLDDMRETLNDADGVGLAAPQVGVLRRAVLIMELEDESDGGGDIIELINPEIILSEGELNDAEGCLSVPGKFGYVNRPAKITVRAMDRFGETFEREASGINARTICHEIDHLEGVMFTELIDGKLLTPDELEEEEKRREKQTKKKSAILARTNRSRANTAKNKRK